MGDDTGRGTIRAAQVVPGKPESARVADVEVVERPDEVVADGLLVGVCGTDVEIVQDGFGVLPPGRDAIVPFHESLGRVVGAPDGSGFEVGDLIAGVVRRPDPEPCPACAVDAWDFCQNGGYRERGIKELDGYGMRRWSVPAEFAVRLDPALGDLGVLTEPASVVAKAWAQAQVQWERAHVPARSVLVTGAGPIGLLAALLGVQRGFDVHVVDRATGGPKPDLVRDLGAAFHTDLDQVTADVDVAIECTGVAPLIWESVRRARVTVLAGLAGEHDPVPLDPSVFDDVVLGNKAVVGTVNAGLADYRAGADALARADHRWLAGLITRRVPLERFSEALERREDDVKVVVDLD
ncbi:threonine dehydrogenase-like Zn-dependent dehydrogenase [Saccharothrix tamanrassetensis]|uniref:Threonine dehydrogenase-like Zn-dependent dehydrogenase n=1 Tax=Saccharothrix tamanrassetensis TaxID=1051531 RepID=A0A841C7T1_9PSEU|nr:alcohol dehydrogenase catalytic domain-containing protein [Saccharothrix tamanrassetensis]MBB5954562.1 threonine dehydrogenase-like Zn-dependent dehydrogenase [Saccharothrix tamanrassetensis]